MKKASNTTTGEFDQDSSVAASEQVTHLNPHSQSAQLAYLAQTASGILTDPSQHAQSVKTPRKRKKSFKALAASGELESDQEQDNAPSDAMAQDVQPSVSAIVQTHHPLTLNLQDPFDKNLLDSCLAYTGRSCTLTSKSFTLTETRGDGSLAYRHVLVIPPSEEVGHTSLGELKMYPKLDAHFSLHAWHERYVFERVATQSPQSTKINHQWQCVEPNAKVPAEELAMLPQECAVGTLVITKKTAKRMATEILASGGDVPAYVAAHDLVSPPTQATALTLTRSSTAIPQTHSMSGDLSVTQSTTATIASTARPATTIITLPQLAFSQAIPISAEKANTPVTSASVTTLPAANTFGRVMQALTPAPVTKISTVNPVATMPKDLLAQLSVFTEDDLPDETKELLRVATAQDDQIKQEQQKMVETAQKALQAYIVQQNKTLAEAQEKRARLQASLKLPSKKDSIPKPNN